MPAFAASLGSVSSGLAFLSHFFDNTCHNAVLITNPAPSLNFPCTLSRSYSSKRTTFLKVSVSSGCTTRTDDGLDVLLPDHIRQDRLSPAHSCKEPHKSIQDIARALTGSIISVKVIQADEENKKLIFSEKESFWSKYSSQLKVGDRYEGIVGSVEDYGAFVHLRFPDGQYHLTGLVHVSEVSWDLVQDVRDVLAEGDKVNVKIVNVDREKARITLSIKQLEEDPLLETLDKVIPQDVSVDSDTSSAYDHLTIEPLPGLDTIMGELLKEDGIDDVRISRQGFEKRVVSQDLQLWLSNAPPTGNQYTLLARAGRQVQEIQITTSLDQEGIKRALQHVLERVP